MNKRAYRIISFLLIQLLIVSNIAMAFEGNSLDFKKAKNAQEHLSPRILLNTTDFNSMFINGLPAANPGFFQSITSFKGLTEYAQAKQDAGKINNPIYRLLRKRLARRNTLYIPKAKQKKEFFRNIKKLKKLLSERRKWIKSDLIKLYDQQINSFEGALDAVKTQGDWEDLLGQVIKLNRVVSKHGAFFSEISRFIAAGKKKELLKKVKTKNKTLKPKSTKVLPKLTIEEPDQSLLDLKLFEDIPELAQSDNSNAQSVILRETTQDVSAQSKNFSLSAVSAREPILKRAMKKLNEVFDAAYQGLPVDIVIGLQEKINQLQKSIDVVKKGEFSSLKKQLRAIETELLTAIKENNNKMTAVLPEPRNESIQASEITQPNNGNPQASTPKKQAEPLDEFAQAVTLCDPENIPLRSVEDVKSELNGQVALLKQVIDAEMDSGMEQLVVFNISREFEGLVIQVRFSEVLAKIESGSDIVMELEGKYYELKCSNILNAGSKLLLKPANKKTKFSNDLFLDRTEVKFYYIPSTHSEDLQKKTLQTIIRKINGKDKSTGNDVLDCFLRIKSAVKDITDIEELKEDIPYAEGMDKFQKAAVNMIVKTKFGLVLGPFGTGKTSVLLAAAKNIILKEKKPVFIIAPQHKIADDITLKAGNSQMPVMRCGKNQRKINPEVMEKYSRHSGSAKIEFIRRYKELNLTQEDNGCLFVGTDMGASLDLLINQLRDQESAKFLKDVTVIVDEAALINYPELITALYILKPDALILVGDHLQFSPYKLASRFSGNSMEYFQKNISQKAICRYHISSFKELIAMPFNRVSLLINYRNPWISVDLLKEWYRGVINLQSISQLRGDKIDIDTFVIEDTSKWEKQSFAAPYKYGNSLGNRTEALWILKRIKYFLAKEENKAKDISILTYYTGQIQMISDLIDADGDISIADALILKQNIFTPISFQGGEDKIVLVSFVRSEKNISQQLNGNSFKKTNPMFLSEPEFAKSDALLVLLSRNKCKLSVIGDRETLDALTKQNYPRTNYLYSCLFNYKDRVQACLDMQNIELSQNISKEILENTFVQLAI